MHIALIVPAPFDTISGGYEYDRRIVAGLRTAGHVVDVHELAGRHPLPDDDARIAAQAVWQTVDERAIMVIDGLALPSFAGIPGFSRRGVVVLNHHPTGLETGLDDETASFLNDTEQNLMAQTRHIVTTSKTTASTLRTQFAVPNERITVIEPGTEAAPRSTGSDTATINILSIGSLIPRKGHDVLLAALARLFDLDWHLTIAGSPRHDPATAARLMALPEALGIAERVTFRGEMLGAPLADLWLHADLFALATHYEGYGMVVAEALNRGLPVAVCGGGAAGALVTAETGVVCPPGDVDQLSKALRRLIFDAGLRADLAEAAWNFGQTLPGWQDQADRFAAALGANGPN